MGNLNRRRAIQCGTRRRSRRWQLFVARRAAKVHGGILGLRQDRQL
jgi:hypothetical protein